MTRILTTVSDVYGRMLESLNGYNNVKYMPYRIALKLTVLQKYTSCKSTFLYIPITYSYYEYSDVIVVSTDYDIILMYLYLSPGFNIHYMKL